MNSLHELEEHIADLLANSPHKGRLSQYDQLVKCAIRMEGMGTDGRVMMEVERATEEKLESLTDADLLQMWSETEAGQEPHGENEEPCRVTMVQAITAEMVQTIAHRVCAEAERAIRLQGQRGNRRRHCSRRPCHLDRH